MSYLLETLFKYDMSRGEKWYEHQPEEVMENEKCKILWDMNIQCDHVIEVRRPDIVVVEKKNNKAIIVDKCWEGSITLEITPSPLSMLDFPGRIW